MKQLYKISWQNKCVSLFLWIKNICTFHFKELLSKVATLLEMLKYLITWVWLRHFKAINERKIAGCLSTSQVHCLSNIFNEKQGKNRDVYCLSWAEVYSELPDFQPCIHNLWIHCLCPYAGVFGPQLLDL